MSIAFLLTSLVVARGDGVHGTGAGQMMDLSGVFMALTFVVFALYGIFAATVRTQVISRPKVMLWLRRTFAATYLLLAGRLAAESR